MEQSAGGGAAGVLTFILFVGLYLFFAYCMVLIAKKTGHDKHACFGWIPILNMFLMIEVAGKQWWWLLLLLIPLVNIVIGVLIMMGVAAARGKPSWIGILSVVPIVGIFVLPYLAFSN